MSNRSFTLNDIGKRLQAARRTIQGYEAVHMIRKGQVRWIPGDHLVRQNQFIDKLFDLAA